MAGSQGKGPLWPELESGQPGPLYGLFGSEDFLVRQVVERFKASPAFTANPELNLERFNAEQTPPARVLESARTLPFLGSRRLVLVSQLQAWRAAQLAEFLEYIERPVETTCLVFYGSRLDGRSKFAKALGRSGQVHTMGRMYPGQLGPWLQSRAAWRDKRLLPEAEAFLQELSGLGLDALDSEIEKLALYTGRRREISWADAEAVVGQGRLYSIFDLTDAVAARDLPRALVACARLDSLGEPPVLVVAMIGRLYRQLLTARGLLSKGGSPAQVQKALRTPQKATATLLTRARAESQASLAAQMKGILAADRALKSSPASARVTLERLIMELCAGRPGKRPTRGSKGAD